jgi:hypothetical protein
MRHDQIDIAAYRFHSINSSTITLRPLVSIVKSPSTMAPQVQIAIIRPLPIVIPIAAPAWAAELPVLAVGRTVDQYEISQATIKILNAIKNQEK